MLRAQLFVLICLLCCAPVLAQEEVDLFDLSLEELMNVEIVSASKKSENLFDAPVSSYTITRDEIARAGVTSIPEALRLCPGVVVREITNGNYDIHLRGFDNLVRYSESFVQNNLLTLVMVDDRPVFNYNMGGTIWESLPVDLIDIERIEIVRGPAAPLFGPNAVTGVINIITRRIDKPGLYVSSHLQYGTPEVLGANVAVGNKFSDQLDVVVSANYQQRERSDEGYYVYQAGQFFEDLTEAGVPFADAAYPNPEQALERYAINGLLNYQPHERVKLSLATGLQQASAQRLYFNFDITALTTSTINRNYIHLNSSLYGVGAKVFYENGSDNLYQGLGVMRPEYGVKNTGIILDYSWKVTDKLSLRPELSYQRAAIDDQKYANLSQGITGLVNGKVSNHTLSGSLKVDYRPTEPLRLVGAVRIDKFRVPRRAYASYQLAATYKIKERFLLRAVQSRSTSGAFLGNYFLDVPLVIANAKDMASYRGNTDIDVASNVMTEVGLRVQATDVLQFDIDVFRQRIKDLSYPLNIGITPLTEQIDLYAYQYLNLPTTAVQQGLTLSANIVPNPRIQVKPFVTLQKTDVENLPIGGGADLANQVSDEHQATPTVYGGAFVNYLVHRKVNVNLNTYFFDQHTMYHLQDLWVSPTTPVGQIKSKLLLNAKVTYRVVNELNVYVNGRNLLDQNSREYYGTDRIGRSFFVGASYNF